MASAGVVLAETADVRTPISASWATPVTHHTDHTSINPQVTALLNDLSGTLR